MLNLRYKLKVQPLYARITIFSGIILSIIFMIFIYFSQTVYLHYVHQQIELRATTLVDNLAQNVLTPLLNFDYVTLQQNSASFVQQRDVLYAVIVSEKGEVLAQVTQPDSPIHFSADDLPWPELRRRGEQRRWVRYKNQGQLLEVIQPILANNNPWGWAVIGLDLNYFIRLVNKVRWFTFSIGLISIILAILVIQKISQRIVSPIDDLIKGTEEISDGNFTYQIRIRDEGELGQLARKFNEMVLKLHYYYRQKEILNKKLHEYSEQLEERVRERTEELQQIRNEVVQIFHQIPIGLLVCTRNGDIRWYNEELLKIFNIQEPQSLKVQNLLQKDPFSNRELTRKLRDIIVGGEKVEFEFSYQAPSRERKILQINSQPFREEHGEISSIIFTIRNVTLEKELIEKINRTKRLESMGILAGGIAHDFNNLLAIILPNAQMLKLHLQNQSKLLTYLETIERATEQAAQLASQILSFARGSKHGVKTILNLNQIVTDFSSMFHRIVSKKVQIHKELSENLWNIEADKTQIEQILMNMSMNALDAMPHGGSLIFRTSNIQVKEKQMLFSSEIKPGTYVKLEIADTGTGIPPQIIDKIFDPFFSSKKEGKGTGLGLSMVYGIIKSYRGYIDVRSEPNQGSQFSIYFPAVFKPVEEEQEVPLNVRLGSGKIMVVDDEKMLQITLYNMLESMNYEVLIANNGREALELFQKHEEELDVIIMDLQMPEMDGLEAASRIWEKNPKVKIIFSSGYADPTRLEELRKMGVKEFLKKPYKIKDLTDILERTLTAKA